VSILQLREKIANRIAEHIEQKAQELLVILKATITSAQKEVALQLRNYTKILYNCLANL